jgi:TRAP-type C4-dicarboxylate transport system substrate-binding protein
MLAAAARAELRGWEMSAATTVAQMAILKKNGMTVVNAPDSVITKMKEIGKEMMAGWRKDASPEAIAVLDRYLALQ